MPKTFEHVKYNQLYLPKRITAEDTALLWTQDEKGNRRRLTSEERDNPALIPLRKQIIPTRSNYLCWLLGDAFTTLGVGGTKHIKLAGNHHWKTTPAGMRQLGKVGRLQDSAGTIRYVRYVDDFPVSPLQNIWEDTGTGQYTEDRLYVVQTIH